MIFSFNLGKFIISLLIPLTAGGISTLITGGDMQRYSDFIKPPLSPPAIVFPIVWTILYILMGISLYLVWNKQDSYQDKNTAFFWFALQLFFNFIWSPIFFSAQQYLLAFIILVLMWISTLAMIISFYRISKPAALLQIPYLIWLTFAGYLNLGVYLLN